MGVQLKSFSYDIGLTWSGEKKGMLSAVGKPNLEVATPPEFKGHPGIWSPEDLVVAAATACLMTTFVAYAAKANVVLRGYEATATGVVELVDGAWRFTSISLLPSIVVSNEEMVEPARALLQRAKDNCLVANSLNARVVLDNPKVTAARAVTQEGAEL